MSDKEDTSRNEKLTRIEIKSASAVHTSLQETEWWYDRELETSSWKAWNWELQFEGGVGLVTRGHKYMLRKEKCNIKVETKLFC